MRGHSEKPLLWFAFLAIVSVYPRPSSAHDSWLVVSSNHLTAPSTVRAAFLTGEQFPISQSATSPDRVAQWTVHVGSGRQELRDFRVVNQELVVDIPLQHPGLHVIAIALKPKFIEIEAPKFEEYLTDEQARAVLEARHSAGQRDQTGREYYTKFSKTFVEVGDQEAPEYLKPIGHKLEIIPLSNPCRWRVGDEVSVRVLLDGKPAAKLRVSSGREGLPEHTYVEHVLTDSEGTARFKPARSGLWFIRTHFIGPAGSQRHENSDVPAADWESFWASITFRIQDQQDE